VSEHAMKLVGNWVEKMLVFSCGLIAPDQGWPIAENLGATMPSTRRNVPCLYPVGVIRY
jgi:hypothetical protein